MRQKINNRGHKVNVGMQSSRERLYEIKNKEKRKAQAKIRYDKDHDHILELRRKTGKIKYARERESLMKILGGATCIKCGFSDVRALQFEHIHDDGHIDKKRFTRRDQFMRFYIENPSRARETLQVYCANCNQIKLHE